MTIHEIIQSLRETPSRKEKEAILKQHSGNIELKKALAMAYNQLTNYYMATVKPTTYGTQDLNETSYSLLIQASNREITGNELTEKVTNHCNNLNKESQEVFKCILEKDFKCGVTATTLSKIWPEEKAFRDFKVMLCDDFEKNAKKVKYPVLVQLKYDASRVIIMVEPNKVTYYSRNGKEYLIEDKNLKTNFLDMHNKLAGWKDHFKAGVVFDGELYAMEEGKILNRQISNGIATKLVRGTSSKEEQAKIGITIWDCVVLKDFLEDKDETHYSTRLEWVGLSMPSETSGRIRTAETYTAWTEKEVYEIADNMITARGEEGVIVKNPLGHYESKRSKNCLKIKDIQEIDLEIIDIVDGTGKYKGKLGALTCQDKSGKLIVNVGTGLTDEDRVKLNNKEIIGKILTVKYNMMTKDKNGDLSLFLPRFVEVRHDKTEADSAPLLSLISLNGR